MTGLPYHDEIETLVYTLILCNGTGTVRKLECGSRDRVRLIRFEQALPRKTNPIAKVRNLAALNEIIDYADRLLDAESFKDYCPNGLQVQGRGTVTKVITGVTANRDLIEAAIERGAHALLVHHGYFWRGEDACITGMKRERLKRLLENEISLIAYHLPLDAHAEVGNNVCLARVLGFAVEGPLGEGLDRTMGLYGSLAQALDAQALLHFIEQRLGRPPLLISGGTHLIRSIGWCTGAAQGFIERAAAGGLDAYLSGEISEPTVHVAREAGIHYVAAGHHATERYGVQALGDHLARKFRLQHEFVDIDNPV